MALSATLAIAVGFAARSQLREGMGYWALGLLAHTVAYLLFAMRGQISDWISIVLGNVLLSSVFAMFAEGVFQFQRRRPPRWLLWSPVFLVAVLFSALLHWYMARVVLGPSFMSSRVWWWWQSCCKDARRPWVLASIFW